MGIIKKYGLIFASAILLATAVFVSVNKSDGITARAEGTEYTATWTATKILTLNVTRFLNNTRNIPLDIPLGVSEWEVRGSSSGTPLYSETWKVEDTNMKIVVGTTNPSQSGCGEQRVGAFGSSNWLVSISSTEVFCGKIESKKIADIITGYDNTRPRQKKTFVGLASCFDARSANVMNTDWVDTCFQSVGAYGFALNDSEGSTSHGPGTLGTIMPLKWTVTGKIN